MKDGRQPPELTSAFLLNVLEDRDAQDDPTHAAAEREAARLVRVITRQVLDSRQNLVDLPIDSLDELVSFRQAGTWLLNDFYCHDLLTRVPKMVRRTLELSSLTIPADRLPKGSVSVFYGQAIRCYIFGLWQAAAVLARSTVETALREKVQGHVRDRLEQLIAHSVRLGVLNGHAIEAASVVKALGDPAVHGKLVKEQDAKAMVTSAREVVLAVFGGRMGDESRP
jgi:hypothetical protein